NKLSCSVFILTLNEADRIERTIEAIKTLFTDIVVVDSGSDDGTPKLATRLGARVIHREWAGYGEQKNFAQDQCRHAWVFNIDADEVVTTELCAELRDLFAAGEPELDAYRVRIVDVIPGEDKPRPFAY